MPRGALRIYLGAAPGVGKTVAMLDDGHRRRARGTDVVVAVAQTRGRSYAGQCLAGLPAVAPTTVERDGRLSDELDLAAVLERRPAVALVDDLAHRNVAGAGAHECRWQDVDELLDAGIDVVSTLNIWNLESLSDVTSRITGAPPQDTVPDAFVRSAEQIELVDITPEALLRRFAHGNLYPPEQVDATLRDYLRLGNLTALRELALLWLADSVEEVLQRHRAVHGADPAWETKERIVLALSGGPEGEALIRRAARIVSRTVGGELLAVHVARSATLSEPGVAGLGAQRLLVESVGGTYHSVVGDDVPQAVHDFARRVGATQIIAGASRRSGPFGHLRPPGIGARLTAVSGDIDVHLVPHGRQPGAAVRLPPMSAGLTPRRRVAGLVCAVVLLPLITLVCTALRHHLDFAAEVPLYLLAVVITSIVGGFYPALLSAAAASLLLDYYFTTPYHTLSVSLPSNIVALVIFVLIAVLVSQVVDLAARRSALAARATAEAETLTTFAGSLLRGEQALPALLERVRETFALQAIALLRRDPDSREWTSVEAAGSDAPRAPAEASACAQVDEELLLALRGRPLSAGDQRLLAAFTAHVAVAYRQQQLADAARAAEPLVESDRQRTALLSAVSHDLRTPIAAAKAAVSSLRTEVPWTLPQRAEFLQTAEDALDRLTGLVTNLLDLSRLQVGALPVMPSVVGVDDVVASALAHADPDSRIEVDVPADLPAVVADAGLLERVIANVLQNALRYAPADTTVRVVGTAHRDHVELRVVDRGPGIPRQQAEAVFQPFQRADDTPVNGAGAGLGLAIARGFAQAMGGDVVAEPTPGGGATVVITLRTGEPTE